MTLGDGKRKVLMLLDEYSSGGALTLDEDIALKMHDFFDIAQRDMALWQPILRRAELTLDGSGDEALPEDVARVLSVRKDGRRQRGFEVLDGRLRYAEGVTASVTLDYIATPERITPDTEDEREFEVSEEAANCLPFFVAAQHLVPDLVVDYGAFYNLYLQMRQAVPRANGFIGSGGGLRQELYRR